MLIDEIASVTRDLSWSPPREYSFEEWMWYLKLICDDNDYPQNHSISSSAATSKEEEEKSGNGQEDRNRAGAQ